MPYKTVIAVNHVSKEHRIYERPSARLVEMFTRKTHHKTVHSLKDITFNVDRGDTVGIIGRNGAGKSTLLQIIAGTQRPTSGDVSVDGRVSALLELGAGFNMDFTGRENVYLYGSILGLTREQIRERYERILAFAEIGEFIDYPVKTYSSGMFVRLAFSVAINVDPDVLIVDEALSVGDVQFQHKCIAKLKQLQHQGCTILFVSHDIDSIKSLCSSAILLNRGQIHSIGSPEEVSRDYMELIHVEQLEKRLSSEMGSTMKRFEVVDGNYDWTPQLYPGSERHGNRDAEIVRLMTFGNAGQAEVDAISYGERLQFSMLVEYRNMVNTDINVGIMLRDDKGVDILGDDSWNHGVVLPVAESESRFVLEFEFPHMWLKPGTYSVTVALGAMSEDHQTWNDFYYDWIERAMVITVKSAPDARVWSKVLLPANVQLL